MSVVEDKSVNVDNHIAQKNELKINSSRWGGRLGGSNIITSRLLHGGMVTGAIAGTGRGDCDNHFN
jgi:hypothetical protein